MKSPAPSASPVAPPGIADEDTPFARCLPALAFVTLIFFLNFMSRAVLAPVMLPVQNELGISHAASGRLFLIMSLGISSGMFLSGFISRVITHRRTVVLSALLMGTGMLGVALAQDLTPLKLWLVLVGFGSGVYLPSGIPIITELSPPKHWGKALSVHELAPNLSFVLAPLLAEAAVRLATWRAAFLLLGVCHLVAAVAFWWRGPGGRFRGMALSPRLLGELFRLPVFWCLLLFFAVAVGAAWGPWAMLQLFLASEHGYTRAQANELLTLARISGVVLSLTTGWLTDRLGFRATLQGYFALTGVLTIALGLASGGWLVAVVVIQQGLTVCFFPAAFTAISRSFPAEWRSAAVSLISPSGALLGAGLAPAVLGYLGERGSFDAGFIGLGCLVLGCLVVLWLAGARLGGQPSPRHTVS